MRGLRGALATSLVLGLAACGRAAPEARFDGFTAPFVRVSGICWPLPVSPDFPWLMRQRTVVPLRAGKEVLFTAQAFARSPGEVASGLDAALVAADFVPQSPLAATGATVIYRRGNSSVSVRVVPVGASKYPVTATVDLAMRARTVEAGPCPSTEDL